MEQSIAKKKLLSIENLVVEYTSDGQVVHAVNGVSFDLEEGKTIGLVGETGAGKTTIAKAILRILPDRGAKIKSGKIYLNGEDVVTMKEKDIRKVRGNVASMIFQDPMTALNPCMSVGNQISEVVKVHNNMSKDEAEETAKKMLETVGIGRNRFHEYPHQFSGGMKQRVVIAIALACNPSLLLADEPTTALDVTIQAQVLELIRQLREKYKTSMILITHDLGVVAETCDDVAIIYAGQVVEYGSKEAVFLHPSHPYTVGLFGALPDMLSGEDEWLHPIDGLPPDPTNLPAGCPFSPRCDRATDRCKQETIETVTVGEGHLCRCCNLKQAAEEGE
ncbi:ABC transporter ATP-binding protein [Hungatella hathewayi]